MSSQSYSSLLRDARWQRKRLEIMERDDFTCKGCGASDKDEGTTLNVHHAYYVKGKKPWEYDNSSLSTRCCKCHKIAHEKQNLLLSGFNKMSNIQQCGLLELSHMSFMPKFLEAVSEADCLDDTAMAAMVNAINRSYTVGREDAS
jgi:hypothetical protein